MAPKIFITGVTGYIAGDAFYAIHREHPNFDYTFLVRTQEKAALVHKAYPSVRIVIGDLDNSNLLETEAARADIVLHAADASDHLPAARSIATGLIKGHSKTNPGYWLHTGGTGILTYTDSENDFAGLGTRSEKQYNDLSGVDELINLPDEAFHRNVDKVVIETGVKHSESVKTVVVCPPTIYGRGRGPAATRGRQTYELANLVLRKRYIPIVGEGKARWNNVHIEDLSDVYRLLVNAAVNGKSEEEEVWGAKGYVFTENGEHVWGDLAKAFGERAESSGYVTERMEEYSLEKDEALEIAGFEAVSWGLSSRGKAERAREVLGWRPVKASIEEHVGEILQDEWKRLGK